MYFVHYVIDMRKLYTSWDIYLNADRVKTIISPKILHQLKNSGGVKFTHNNSLAIHQLSNNLLVTYDLTLYNGIANNCQVLNITYK